MLFTNMIMEEEQTWKSGKTNNWATGSKKQRKLYRQFLQDKHTPLTPERKSSLKNIGFVLIIEKGISGKGPIRKKKKPDKKRNMCLSMVHYGKWRYPNNDDVLDPRFHKLSLYDGKAKIGRGDCYLYLVHKYADLLNNMSFKFRFVDLQNK